MVHLPFEMCKVFFVLVFFIMKGLYCFKARE